MTDGYVAALLHEREGLVAAKKWDRVRQVDVELARFGIAVGDDTPEAAVEPAPENAAKPRGRPRKR